MIKANLLASHMESVCRYRSIRVQLDLLFVSLADSTKESEGAEIQPRLKITNHTINHKSKKCSHHKRFLRSEVMYSFYPKTEPLSYSMLAL